MTRRDKIYPAGRVTLREVGLRDGLQLVRSFPDTAAKLRWMASEHAAGVRAFEAGSFLPATRMPQFADVREVIGAIARMDGAYAALLKIEKKVSWVSCAFACLRRCTVRSGYIVPALLHAAIDAVCRRPWDA